jgi:hypothetical protein
MREASYDLIDAAKHRSSRSRVPGLRAGHSFMWSQPLFPRSCRRAAGREDFAELNGDAEALAVRAIPDQSRKSFVLSRINAIGIRAFADQ